MRDHFTSDPQALSMGTTTAHVVHKIAIHWLLAITQMKFDSFPLYKDMELIPNEEVINAHHGISVPTQPGTSSAFHIPSTLQLDHVVARSASLLSSQSDRADNMDIDQDDSAAHAPAAAASVPPVVRVNWLSIDIRLIALALATQQTIVLYMTAIRTAFSGPETYIRQTARFIKHTRFYTVLLIIIFIGYWPAVQGTTPEDLDNVLVMRRLIMLAVSTTLSEYRRILRCKCLPV